MPSRTRTLVAADDGVPDLPRAWIIRTARHKAIDRLRRQRRFADKVDAHAATDLPVAVEPPDYDPDAERRFLERRLREVQRLTTS